MEIAKVNSSQLEGRHHVAVPGADPLQSFNRGGRHHTRTGSALRTKTSMSAAASITSAVAALLDEHLERRGHASAGASEKAPTLS